MPESRRMENQNKHFGISRWHISAQCFYCCYCDTLGALTHRELKSIKEYQPLEPPLEEWQKVIEVYKKPGELGSLIGFRQMLHRHCMLIINNTDKGLLPAIKRKNPNNQYIPERPKGSEKSSLLVIKELKQIPKFSACLRCQAHFHEKYLGFAFSHKGSTHYIHSDCYQLMLDYQAQENRVL